MKVWGPRSSLLSLFSWVLSRPVSLLRCPFPLSKVQVRLPSTSPFSCPFILYDVCFVVLFTSFLLSSFLSFLRFKCHLYLLSLLPFRISTFLYGLKARIDPVHNRVPFKVWPEGWGIDGRKMVATPELLDLDGRVSDGTGNSARQSPVDQFSLS